MEQLKCWPSVVAMFENGMKVPVVARYIQEDCKENTDVSRQSLERLLHYWLRKNADRPDIDERTPTRHVNLIESAPDRIDPLDALNMLFAIQVDRITDFYKIEKRANNFNTFNNDAIRLAKDIAQTMANIEAKRRPSGAPLGSEGKAAVETFNQTQRLKKIYEDKFGGVAAAVLLNDESRRKIVSVLDKIRKGNSPSLGEILNANVAKADELRTAEEVRVAEEGATIDVESKASVPAVTEEN